jgi:hypothetical protein
MIILVRPHVYVYDVILAKLKQNPPRLAAESFTFFIFHSKKGKTELAFHLRTPLAISL